MLAARCYLKAAKQFTDPQIQESYRKLASETAEMQLQRTYLDESEEFLRGIEADFERELQEADEWYAALREHELQWIQDGTDVDAEFSRLYQADPIIETEPEHLPKLMPWAPIPTWAILIATGLFLGLSYLGFRIARGLRTRWNQSKNSE